MALTRQRIRAYASVASANVLEYHPSRGMLAAYWEFGLGGGVVEVEPDVGPHDVDATLMFGARGAVQGLPADTVRVADVLRALEMDEQLLHARQGVQPRASPMRAVWEYVRDDNLSRHLLQYWGDENGVVSILNRRALRWLARRVRA